MSSYKIKITDADFETSFSGLPWKTKIHSKPGYVLRQLSLVYLLGVTDEDHIDQ